MKVETQDLENRQVQLTVEVADDRLQAAMHRAARKMGSTTKIPGFRPGKAPYEVVLGRFGEEAVFEEALDSLGQEVYREALTQTALEPFAPGSLDQVISRAPLVLRYTVPLPPQVELGSYRDLRIPFDPPQVSDPAVDQFLEELRQSQALIEPADRPLQLGDVAVVDIRGEIASPPEETRVLLDQKGVSILVAEETDWPVPGVAQHLVDTRAGESREFEYLFPSEYPAEDLRGQTARFHVTCAEVKSRTVPEWSDSLAKSLGDFQDQLDLRIKVRQSLEDQARREGESSYAERMLAAVVDGAAVSYPPQLMREELDDMIKDLDRRLRDQKLSLADYLKVEKKTEEQLRSELEPRANERLKRALVLSEVVEVEHLEVAEAEVTARIEQMVASAGKAGDSLRKVLDHPSGRRKLAADLLTEKAIQRLTAIARGEAPPIPAAGEAEEAESAPASND